LRRYVKITGAVINPDIVTLDNKNVAIYGRAGAQISRTTNNEVLAIKGTSEVTVTDLEIVGNTGSGDKDCVEVFETASVTMTRVNIHNHGIAGIGLADSAKLMLLDSQVHDNAKEGVKATGGTLELQRSSVYVNRGTAGVFTMGASMVKIDSSVITRNTGTNGGVSITGPFSIKNSIISGNGDTATVVGGLTLSSTGTATFEFNTVAENITAGIDLGMSCLNQLDVSNSIFTANAINGCNVTYSLVDNTTTNPGMGNMMGMPTFLNTDTSNPLGPTFYRISGTSSARDMANPAATLDIDIDGQKRDDIRKDMGADEFR